MQSGHLSLLLCILKALFAFTCKKNCTTVLSCVTDKTYIYYTKNNLSKPISSPVVSAEATNISLTLMTPAMLAARNGNDFFLLPCMPWLS